MKKFLAAFLALALLLDGSLAFAGKSYSSGGSRSGGSFSGRSYSGGGSSYSGRSYSSGSGRSYSSGGSSYKPSFTPSKPSYSPPSSSGSGKSYSSGSSSKPYTPSYKPSSPSPSAPSGKSYSSGSSSKPYTPSYTPPATSGSGKSYSSGSPSATSAASGETPKGKPSGSTFNSGLSRSAKEQESQTRYQAANAPKPSYTPPAAPGTSSKPKPLNPDSAPVQTVRRHVTHERYITYDNRASAFYGGYYGSPVYYHDPFSPFLWGWIMSDAINSHQRALWMYHHQSEMDSARYQAMLAKDARLQAEIDALKAQNLARDPSYVPPQMKDNPDLMYNKEFVDASYNPVPVAPEATSSSSAGASVVATLFWTVVILSIGGIFIYFMFIKEYEGF